MMRDIARRAIGEKCILEAARELHDETRAALAAGMQAGDRLQVDTLGMVYVSAPKGVWRVADPAALLEWAREHAPHLIVSRVVEEVPTLPLDSDGELPLPTGESVRPDGVEWVQGAPILTVKPTVEARIAAKGRLRELES